MKKIVILVLFSFVIFVRQDILAQIHEIDSLEKLLEKYIKDDTIRINLLNETAYMSYTTDVEKTLKYAKKAGKLSDKLNYAKGKAESLRLIGVYYIVKSNYPQAIEYYEEALKINEQINEKKGVSICLNNIGLIYSYQSNYPKSLEYYNKALKIDNELSDVNGISKCLNNIGIIYYYQGNFPKALEYYHKALKLYEEIGDKKNANNCMNNIGLIHKKQGDYTEALEYYQRALQINEELNNKAGIADCFIHIANIFSKQGNYLKALEFLEKSLEMAEESGDKLGTSVCLNNIGDIYSEQGNYTQGLEYYQKALQIKKDIGDKSGICLSYLNIGEIYLRTNQFNKALEYSLKSLKIANELELLDDQKDIHYQLSEIYAFTRNYKYAYENYVKYKILNDSIFNEENIKEIAGLEYQYKYEKEKQAIELDQQKKDAVLKEEVKRQKTVRNSFIIGFIFMFLLVTVVVYSLIQKRRANRILTSRKKEIENKNEELHQQNEEIHLLNEELSSANDQLYAQREELKVTLNRLKETQSQLVQTEKMASVGILTSGIAHEINNPLNFIQGGKLAIENYVNEHMKDHSSELSPLLEMVETGIKRATGIVHSLNRFSRKSVSNTEECDMHSIIDNCLVMLNSQIKNKIGINKEYTDFPHVMFGNDERLHQVIMNILINAIQAIEEKGSISIITNVEKEKLLIQISDSGSGISVENINKVTDPFFTTKDPGKGTGLGLSIAYSIIKEHKGTIVFNSEINKGTTVTISFPLNKL